jgi:sortase A
MSVSSVGSPTGTSSPEGPGGIDPPPPPDDPASLARLPLGPTRRVIREIGLALITAGVVVLLFVGYQLFGTGIVEAKNQQKLKNQFEHLVAAPAPPATPAPLGAGPTTTVNESPSPTSPTGEAVAHLVIPKIGVDKFVIDSVTLAQLRKGPGHYPQTPMPGEQGNAAIAGHRTTYGAPFYRLNELQAGDEIFVTTRAGQFRYAVTQSRVISPTEVSVLDPTPDYRLTLTTCNPRFSASTRLVVVGRLIDAPVPTAAPAPSVAAVPGTGTDHAPAAPVPSKVPLNLGAGDGTAWPPTLLFGAITLLLWIGVRLWGVQRKRSWRWLPFAVGIPLCLVPLWFLFENLTRLLPANI